MTATTARDLRRVRARTTIVATFVAVAILGLAAHALVSIFERELTQRIDTKLTSTSNRFVRVVGALGLPPRPVDGTMPPLETPDDRFQVIDARGALVTSTRALNGLPALWTPGDTTLGPRTVRTERLGMLRILTAPFADRWVITAEPIQPVEDAVASLRRTTAFGLPLIAAALAILIWTVVGRTLRPVAAAVAREERLVADVSHELRTPLAGLRALLETEPDHPREVALTRINALTTLSRLDTITEQLLALTRHRQVTDPTLTRPVDLDEIVVRHARALAPCTSAAIDTSEVEPGQVLGREDDLTSLVENLLTNATHHADATVAVAVHERDCIVELTIDDDGPGIPPQDRDRIFQAFTRLDHARSRNNGGAGLGLAIAHAITDAHNATITVDDSPQGGARFIVRFPASTSPSGPRPLR